MSQCRNMNPQANLLNFLQDHFIYTVTSSSMCLSCPCRISPFFLLDYPFNISSKLHPVHYPKLASQIFVVFPSQHCQIMNFVSLYLAFHTSHIHFYFNKTINQCFQMMQNTSLSTTQLISPLDSFSYDLGVHFTELGAENCMNPCFGRFITFSTDTIKKK